MRAVDYAYWTLVGIVLVSFGVSALVLGAFALADRIKQRAPK